MDRMKTFFKYLLMVVVCYFGSNSLIYAQINNTYGNINTYKVVEEKNIEVNINEAKATVLNGYVNGKIKNISGYLIKEDYIKIDYYSSRDVKMGTDYIKIENLKNKDTMDFNTNFKLANVSYCVISTGYEMYK